MMMMMVMMRETLVQNTVRHAFAASHIRSWYSNIVIHIRNSGIVSLAAHYAAHRCKPS
jgi:hypothetical protein